MVAHSPYDGLMLRLTNTINLGVTGTLPPPSSPYQGTPPPSRCGLTNKLKTLPSPILRMRAVTTNHDGKCLEIIIL